MKRFFSILVAMSVMFTVACSGSSSDTKHETPIAMPSEINEAIQQESDRLAQLYKADCGGIQSHTETALPGSSLELQKFQDELYRAAKLEATRKCIALNANATTETTLPDGSTCGGYMPKNSIRLIPVGCTVSGDVSTGKSATGPWNFEGKHKASDGTMVIVKNNPTWAPYEAHASDATPEEVEKYMKTGSGCTSVCKTVTKVIK